MAESTTYRIVIAEDHALFRDGLSAMLSSVPEWTVVGEAEDGLEVVRLAEKLAPDLILLDLSMPNLGGLDAIRRIRQISPDTRILVVSMHATEKHLRAAIDAGANGYLLKMADQNEFFVAIKAVLKGRAYISSEFTHHVLEIYKASRSKDDSPLVLLTDREREVLKLVAEGNTNKKVGRLLFISAKTADNHRNNIMRKLDLHSARELTAFALRHGLIEAE